MGAGSVCSTKSILQFAPQHPVSVVLLRLYVATQSSSKHRDNIVNLCASGLEGTQQLTQESSLGDGKITRKLSVEHLLDIGLYLFASFWIQDEGRETRETATGL